jgi:hypothetical protein
VFFHAEDLPKAHWKLVARGVQFPVPPAEQSFGWWSVFADPDGKSWQDQAGPVRFGRDIGYPHWPRVLSDLARRLDEATSAKGS